MKMFPYAESPKGLIRRFSVLKKLLPINAHKRLRKYRAQAPVMSLMFFGLATASGLAFSKPMKYWVDSTDSNRDNSVFQRANAGCQVVKEQAEQIEKIKSDADGDRCNNGNQGACISSIVASVAAILDASPSDRAYTGCMESQGWIELEAPDSGTHVIKFIDGAEYLGPFKSGVFDGMGVMRWPDGATYRGMFKNGERSGNGELLYADGNKYVGGFKDGKRDGLGVHHYADGRRYEGQLRAGTLNGKGVMSYPNGRRYEGQFRDGAKHGIGKMILPDGTSLVIKFNKNIPTGKATVIYANGEKFEGTLSPSSLNPDGRGTYWYLSGEQYKGAFLDGKRSGMGLLLGSTGDTIYRGEWGDDCPVTTDDRDKLAAYVQPNQPSVLVRCVSSGQQSEELAP